MPELTKLRLVAALREKMLTKPLGKITIQEITGACGFNRQTFYYHFRDIYDLLQWGFEYDIDRIVQERLTTETWTDTLLQIMQYMEKNRHVILSTLESASQNGIDRFLCREVEPLIGDLLKTFADGYDVDEKYVSFLTHFFTLSISAQLLDWLNGTRKDLQYTAEELVQMLEITITGSVRHAMERYQNDNRNK